MGKDTKMEQNNADRYSLEKNANDKDCRAISKKFLEKFKDKNGKNDTADRSYNEFLKLVKKYSDELVLCFRGNNDSGNSEAVCIYYNNHLVYKIEDNGKTTSKITINFDHARYSKEYKEFWGKINKVYKFNVEAEDVPTIKVHTNTTKAPNVGNISRELEWASVECKEFLGNIEKIYYDCLRPMLIDSFDPAKQIDYFKKAAKVPQSKKNKDRWLEKIRQQQLFSAMKFTENGYFFFDMEFAQMKMENEDCPQNGNQSDMLAIRFDKEGKPCAYAFVEVKTNSAALEGESGLGEHLAAMKEYLNGKGNMEARRREAELIINQYKELGLYSIDENIEIEKCFELDNKSVEILIVLTDGAASETASEKAKCIIKKYVDKDKIEKCGNMGIHLPGCKKLEMIRCTVR